MSVEEAVNSVIRWLNTRQTMYRMAKINLTDVYNMWLVLNSF